VWASRIEVPLGDHILPSRTTAQHLHTQGERAHTCSKHNPSGIAIPGALEVAEYELEDADDKHDNERDGVPSARQVHEEAR
jgi:hypothetical protein